MGTCCSSRTDIAGQEKANAKGGKAADGKIPATGKIESKGGQGVKFNPMDAVRNTITQVLKDTANHEMVVLNLPKESFAQFISDMQALLTLIKAQTGKVFIPISLSQSPIDPENKFIIVLRTSETREEVMSFSKRGWFTENIPQLAKKFVTKQIALDAKLNVESFSIKLTQQLREFYSKDGLSLIGGFVDGARKLNMLFFKLDAVSGPRSEPNIFIESWAPKAYQTTEVHRQEIDVKVNEVHMTSQGILRCAINLGASMGDGFQNLFVYHEEDGDRMYIIMRFQQQLQSSLILQKQAAKLGQTIPECNFDEMMTILVNAQEHKLGNRNALCCLVVGRDFETSFLVVCV